MRILKKLGVSLLYVTIGVVIGGYLFKDSQPRSFLAVNECQRCLEPNELLGLIGSIGVQKMPGILPSVVYETDKSLVMLNPMPNSGTDYVIIPKRDIRDAADFSMEDLPYLIDAYQVAGYLIRSKSISSYRFYTNGPEIQDINYLHFHLVDLGTNEGAEPSPLRLLTSVLNELPRTLLAKAKPPVEVEPAVEKIPPTPPTATGA